MKFEIGFKSVQSQQQSLINIKKKTYLILVIKTRDTYQFVS